MRMNLRDKHDAFAFKFIGSAFLLGLILAAILIVLVFVTGSTFGQRCAKAGYEAEEFKACVKRLVAGESLHRN